MIHMLKKTLVTAFVFLSSFSPFIHSTQINLPHSLNYRLQKILQEKSTNQLHQLFDLYWDWYLETNPDEASYLGYPGKYDQWPDFSFESIHYQHQFNLQILSALEHLGSDHLSSEDMISYQILKRILNENQLDYLFGQHYLMVDQMNGIHLSIALILDMMPHQTLEDYENILSRLRQLPIVFQQIQERLEKGIALGITPPRIAIRNVPLQILNQMTNQALESPLLKAFTQIPNSFDLDCQQGLVEKATHLYKTNLLPALDQFYHYLNARYLPNCRQTISCYALPQGKEWYEHKIRQSTTTTLSVDQIHQIGLKEVQRIYENMLEVMQSTGFNGTYSNFLHFLKTDPQFFYSNREDLFKEYQLLTRHIESKLSLLFSHLPQLPFKVVPIPAYSEESQIGAYYCPGSIADQRPGHFFINTSFPEKRPKWEMEPLALHEAVPGHHLQITLAQELQNLPEFRKHTHFTSYIEGWGLYAESLGSELGLYQNPYSVFGRLSCEMLRAIRLVVDTGMHAMNWTRDQSIDFFKQYLGSLSDHEIVTEVDRYLVMPGQALAYKIGELKIQELKQRAQHQLKQNFDIREFHSIWLQKGALPLDIAEQQIEEWIQAKSL